MASTLHTKILDLYLKGYSNIEILNKLECGKSEIGRVFSRMTEEHHLNLKLKAQNDLAQIGNMEQRLFDKIHKLSDTDYLEQRNNYAKFCVK